MKKTLTIASFLAFAVSVSCGGNISAGQGSENEGNDQKNVAPLFKSSVPADGATGIDYEKSLEIVLTYDQNINCITSDQKLITVDNNATIEKINAYNKDLKLSIGNLKGGTSYILTVPDGAVRGFKENQEKAGGVTLHFTTKDEVLPPSSVVDIPQPEENAAWQMLDRLGLGWNMGNHFDAFHNGSSTDPKFLYPDETCWGNGKCTKSTFAGIYAAGFRSVRIPVTWLKYIGEAPDYKIDESWLNRIIEAVGWARDAHLNVIINTHHDEDHYYGSESLGHRWLNIMEATTSESVNALIKEKIKGFWTNVAEAFKDEGDYLIFESFNEINDGKWGGSTNTDKQAAVLNEWNQVFVDAVRATGGNNATRWLGVPTYAANPGMIRYFTMPSDPTGKTMLSVHCYDPYDYTLAAGLPQKLWGHTLNKQDDEKALCDVFAMLYANFIAKGIPVYMGEFGCSMREHGNTKEWKSYKYYLEYYVKASRSYGLPCFLWDNGNVGHVSECHPYINHANGTFIGHSKEVIDLMVKAMYEKDDNYTLQSVYDNAPR